MNHHYNGYMNEACVYDTNAVNNAINNQFRTNSGFSSNINTDIIDVDSGDLIKAYKQLKSEKESIFNEYLNVKKELEDYLKKQENIVGEQLEKYKQETYKYKCLYEELKIKYDTVNEKNKELQKKIEETNGKYERLKEKNNEKESFYQKLSHEKNLIELKIEKMSKQASEEIDFITSSLEKEKKEKENLLADFQILCRKNEEFKTRYEDMTNQINELTERNKKLERISKMDRKSFQDYGTIQMTEGTPLDQIYLTTNSVNVQEIREEKKPKEENITYQMEVNIARINKNPVNKAISLGTANLVVNPAQSSPQIHDNEKNYFESKAKEETANKNNSYIANLLEDQNNVQVYEYDENDNSEIQQTENSTYSQDVDLDHNSNNYASGNVVYTSNNYDSLRNFQPRLNNRYESEDNNYNSIRGESYGSSVSGVFKH